jgi:hypothetical protein
MTIRIAQSVASVCSSALAERRVGRLRVFVNAENLGNVRQMRWDPLDRPERRPDGRWDGRWMGAARRPRERRVRVAF